MSAYIRYAVGLIGIAIAALRSDAHVALLLMAVVLVLPTPWPARDE